MRDFFRLLQTLDYMRMVVGICILVDGYPLIFFFRETLKLAPNSTTFTAVSLAFGLVLMVPFTFLQRLYRPNITMFWLGVSFIIMCALYMYIFNGDPGFEDYGKDITYYAYILIFLFLLINVPNDIIRVFIPVVVVFTMISNLALIYALMTDPTWAIGQRATITLSGGGDEGSGNPHAFSRNAFMGTIACFMWLVRPQTITIFRLFAFFAGALNLAVLVLTQTRSAIVALIVAVCFFFYYNVRPAQIRETARSLVKPIPLIIMGMGVLGIIYFFRRYADTYGILYGYVISFMERNLDNVYALLGLKAQGADYKAVLDDSAANRGSSTVFFSIVITGHLHRLILGFGYKYTYLDIPIIEALTNQGFIGFILFATLNGMILYNVTRVMRTNPNQLNVFLAYFYMLILVQLFTNGRPYEISFWFPLCLMIRFMGVEHLFPAYLSDHPPVVNDDKFVVVPNPNPAPVA
jgi:uncharacterized membrane protein (UPF0136 family)